ncbi:MAG: EAL domain-containing protein [Proteobacteria bacterium]|nr:EAL domain-containing protein [Pseudomonadota bacterium]
MSLKLHKLLESQLKHLGMALSKPPSNSQQWTEFVEFINKTYKAVDQERHLLEKQATHDPLTGLPNRALLVDRIQQAISVEKRHGKAFGVLFFDLDRFKLINDSLSHQTGDELLQAVANRLRSALRLEDTVSRLGGDEFVMVVLGLEEERSITNIATKLIELFKKPFTLTNREIFVTSSVGISLYPQDGKTAADLLSKADIAMYHAKALGNNHFQFYTPGLNQLAYARLKQEDDLRHAIENKEFFLVYQPQFDMLTQKITSCEALLRWNHPQQGIVSPLDFLPIAEDTGLIIPIGNWVIKEACTQNKTWQDLGLPPIRVAINVSSLQLKHIDFLTVVKETLEQTGLKPEYLEIELSENVILSSPEILKITSMLEKIGVKLALDDFGTGNSSLNYLKQIHINHLKIDQYFVKNIGLDENDEVIIRAIIDMAHGLKYKVLAEGVETQDQLDFLQNKQCEGVQGYFLGKPMVARDFEQFFKKSL